MTPATPSLFLRALKSPLTLLRGLLAYAATWLENEPALVATAAAGAAGWLVSYFSIAPGYEHWIDVGLLAAAGVVIRSQVSPVTGTTKQLIDALISSVRAAHIAIEKAGQAPVVITTAAVPVPTVPEPVAPAAGGEASTGDPTAAGAGQ